MVDRVSQPFPFSTRHDGQWVCFSLPGRILHVGGWEPWPSVLKVVGGAASVELWFSIAR